MRSRNLLVGAIALMIALGTSLAGNAVTLTAIAITGSTNTTPNVSYTPGASGGLVINGSSNFLQGKVGQGFDGGVTCTFSKLSNGSFTSNLSTGAFDQQLNPSGLASFI